MDRDTIISKLKEWFKQKADISAVYLFGSLVKGKQTNNSDIDIAVLFSEDMDSFRRFEAKLDIAGELEDLLAMKVDVVDLESADLFFIHQVMLGKVLVVDNDTRRRVSFEVKSRREYFDMQPFYELYLRNAMERLERY